MTSKAAPPPDVRQRPAAKWQAEECGERYASERWAGKRRAQWDPRTIARLLDKYGVSSGPILDAACGTGRLRTAIEHGDRTWVGLDASLAMLREVTSAKAAARLRGEVEHLPFRDSVFAAVVANRLLHHFHSAEDLRRVLSELLRVSAGPVLVSYWNAASIPAWRRRLGLSKSEGPSGRVAHSTNLLRQIASELNSELLGTRHVLPLFSQQSYAVFGRKSP